MHPSFDIFFAPDLGETQTRILQFCEDWRAGKDTFEFHTSGSTGNSKALIVNRFQLESSAKATAQALGLWAGDRALVALNTDFTAGKMMLVRGLVLGLKLFVVLPSSNPLKKLPEEEKWQNFDFTALVPLQIQTILEESPEKIPILDNMKAILVGGAAVGQSLEKKLEQIKSPVFATFGMTETVSHIALQRLNGTEKQDFFQVLPEVKIGQDENQCLTIQAPMTNNQIIFTNDRVELLNSEQFRWIGRADNTINSGGIKIQLETVEKTIEKLFFEKKIVFRFVCIAIPDEKLGEKLVLVLEKESELDTEKMDLKTLLSPFLNPYEIPKHLFYLEKLPETATGKIDRKQTRQMIL